MLSFRTLVGLRKKDGLLINYCASLLRFEDIKHLLPIYHYFAIFKGNVILYLKILSKVSISSYACLSHFQTIQIPSYTFH